MSEDGCRLYLVAPDPLPADFAALLEAALAAGDVAALRLRVPQDFARDVVASVRPLTVAYGVALILADNITLAAATRCDGVHLSDAASAAMGGDLQVGVFCGLSRDAAMTAGDTGADYVAFGPFTAEPDPEAVSLLTWWSELMELPVVAEGAIGLANGAALAAAGADFLAVGDAVWNDPAGPAAAIRALNAAIDAV